MLTPEGEGKKFESKETLINRADCVRHTAGKFSPSLSPLGEDIGTRYLADDIYVRPGEKQKRLHSTDASVVKKMSQFRDPGIELTDEKIREFDEQEEKTRKAFGPNIVTHARQFGLTEILTPEGAKERLALAPHVDLKEEVNRRLSYFKLNGWEVIPSKKDNKPVLLVPTTSETGQISFETVDLDKLHDRDPEFIPQQVRDYEEKDAMHSLAREVSYNLKLHEVSETELLPKYIIDAAQITDPAQRARAVQSMQTYIAWLAEFKKRGHNFTDIDLIQGLNSRISRSGVYIPHYLEHMAECPAETDETHQKSAEMAHVRKALLLEDYNAPSFDKLKADLVISVLQNPKFYTVNLDLAEKYSNSIREQDQKVKNFIEKTENITDQAQLLNALQQELPDFHDTLVKFQKWLGPGLFEKSRFDELIAKIATKISLADEKFDIGKITGNISLVNEKFNLNKLNSNLRKELESAAPIAKGEFEGVLIESDTSREASLYNPHLKFVLPLMGIKSAQAEAKSEEKKELCQKLTQELAQSYNDKIINGDSSLGEIAEKKAALSLFKEQTGIKDEEITRLIELTKNRDYDDEYSMGVDTALYTGLFNALALEKQGMIDSSQVFKELLKTLFPNRPETVWHNL